jgi:beta-N-acetylhexosaminidase
MKHVKEAIENGTLPMGRVDEAVKRILLTKRRAGAATPPQPTSEPGAEVTVPNGVVVVLDDSHILPLRAVGARYLVVSPQVEWDTPQGTHIYNGATFGAAVRKVVKDATEVRFNVVPTALQRSKAIQEAGQADILIIGTILPKFYTAQRQLVDELLSLGKPTIIVQLGDASELEAFANAPVLVGANGYSPPAMAAAARVLFGGEKPGGRLTAPIGRLFPAGHAD